ncbi:MAG: DUF3109 family protein [Bacteroidota bacterium]
MIKDFIDIENILINEEVLRKKFTCDLNKCKGACCTMESDYGAPLLGNEIEKIESVLPIVNKYLPDGHKNYLENNNFWFEVDGDLMVSSINRRECVFAYYDENEIAKCAIEKAYYEDKTDFIKPISCHLFPIRVNNFGGDILKYEQYSQCTPALELGEETDLSIAEFCKDGLIRTYGSEWYNKLIKPFKD